MDARAVHPNPYRAYKAEDAIKGKVITEAAAESAGKAAVSEACAFESNKYRFK